jgi:hypothetical protein
VALFAGGPDSAANMQWQTVVKAKVKDRAVRLQCRNRQQIVAAHHLRMVRITDVERAVHRVYPWLAKVTRLPGQGLQTTWFPHGDSANDPQYSPSPPEQG